MFDASLEWGLNRALFEVHTRLFIAAFRIYVHRPMAENPQWKIRLDPYHRFVVRRFEKVYGSDRSDVIRTWVRTWVSEHQEQVRQAGASIEDWAQGVDADSEEAD